MGALWLNEGGIATIDGQPIICDDCPCGGDPECQCVMHYYAVWCREYWDWEYHPGRYLTVSEVQACISGYTLVAVSTYIFYVANDIGDGCLRTGGAITVGWAGWCNAGDVFHAWGAGCSDCPPTNGSFAILDVYTGPAGCTNCADSGPLDMSGCTRPTSFESLPADPTIIGSC